MTRNPTKPAPAERAPAPSEVAAQLERILASTEFRRSDRMCRFLRLITEEALSGGGGGLKEYRIGSQVFDRGESFDPRLDPIVRNEARRLRRKLEIYYLTEGQPDRVLIEVPKGSYTPVFTFRGIPETPAPPDRSRSRPAVAAAALMVVAATGVGWWMIAGRLPSASRGVPVSASAGSRSITPAGEAYAVGRRLLFNLRPEDLIASRAQLETAIRLDDHFADAFAALALNHQISAVLGLSPRETSLAASRDLAGKAAGLSAAAGDAAFGSHLALLEEDYTSSEARFQRALAANPNDPVTRAQYAVACLLPLGRADEAQREARRANEMDPQNRLAAYVLALTEYCARDFPSSIRDGLQALGRQPDSVLVPMVVVDSYLASRKFDDAWFFVEKGGTNQDFYRALIRAQKGQKEEALRVARQQAAANAPPVMTARLFAVGGDAPNAVHWLQEAYRQHDFSLRIYLYSGDFDGLRSSSEFASLIAAIRGPRKP